MLENNQALFDGLIQFYLTRDPLASELTYNWKNSKVRFDKDKYAD